MMLLGVVYLDQKVLSGNLDIKIYKEWLLLD
ncbi:MAG: hypothetical protein CM15mP129_03730 [Chloroflexota bacterium]|nr:MAG: hypothetical protein CM15mP129_03730 [Chloroflexota bacterium]